MFSGGFVGVDVFLVISGYLITNIIHAEIGRGEFSIVRFYSRRARRILPALFVVCLACVPFAVAWMSPLQLRDFGESLAAVLGFVSNILFWTESGYFSPAAELKPLLHTWSLAIEEQFYIGFPLLLLALSNRSARVLMLTLGLIGLVSLAVAQYGARRFPEANFYLIHSRGWELGLGALLAIWLGDRTVGGPVVRLLAPAIGLALIIFSVFTFDVTTPYPSIYTALPVLGTVALIACGGVTDPTGRLLAWRPIVWFGLTSYSLYLWHQPLFAFARLRTYGDVDPAVYLLLMAVCVPLAWATWKFVETPFRRPGVMPARRALQAGFATFLMVAAFAAISAVNPGLLTGFRIAAEAEEILNYAEYDAGAAYRAGVCQLGLNQGPEEIGPECIIGQSGKPEILVWGDSHAAALSYGLRMEYDAVLQVTADACPPIVGVTLPGHCRKINDFVLDVIDAAPPQVILLHARWKRWFPNPDQNINQLSRTLGIIAQHAPEASIVVVGGVPDWGPAGLPNLLVRERIPMRPPTLATPPELEAVLATDRAVRAVAGRQSARFVSVTDALCDGGACLQSIALDGDLELSAWDYGHLTRSASVLVARHILAVVLGPNRSR